MHCVLRHSSYVLRTSYNTVIRSIPTKQDNDIDRGTAAIEFLKFVARHKANYTAVVINAVKKNDALGGETLNSILMVTCRRGPQDTPGDHTWRPYLDTMLGDHTWRPHLETILGDHTWRPCPDNVFGSRFRTHRPKKQYEEPYSAYAPLFREKCKQFRKKSKVK